VPIFQLSDELIFPPAHLASEDGILAVGGDTSPERLLLAYSQGIFPWPHRGYPLLWFSPDPRFVLVPQEASISRSLQKSIRKARYRVTCDTTFREVITQCAVNKRPDQDGTWITPEMIEGYCALHEQGL
jgi:leucyl/phenylalanyl-tRNA--protein transferase